MKIISYLPFFFAFTIAVFPFQSKAQPSSGIECSNAESTSSIQKCLKNKLENAQERLSEAYATLEKQFEDQEDRDELKQLQTTWLSYRDEECMWESKQTKSPGLKGISELSCMVRVSEDRADLLEITYMDIDPDITRQYENITRWKNILNNKHKDIFWDFDNATSFDLQCGDTEEIIIQGHTFVEIEENKNTFEKEKVIAVILNPIVGRPDITLFNFKLSEDKNEENNLLSLCSEKVKLSFAKEESDIIKEDTEEEICQSKMTIEQSNCGSKTVMWDGKEFILNNAIISDDEDQSKETQSE